ncbi:NAC domain-containing protein 40 [Ricinus communis]|uniref:NAC domain-containing protein 40 n=1 Tax=Ricinus communis TaxID=3988 RepID=UPI0007728B9C|nr:NAC domain-containing protein 40 [Ricinus communis]|eukprot:XP_015577653.1 NAC domain-containing protein 40 [Ricinus communis]
MAGVSRETQMSIEASSMFPGFRFSPTDVELISYYLKKKMEGAEKCVEVISEVEICSHEPWDLPAKAVIQSENEWFFFSARGRKYPNGTQSRRATELGYWKATGKERNVKSGSDVIGTKRTLVFHIGRAPKGERTEWIMHEYCMHGKPQDSLVVCRLRRNVEFRPNDNSNRNSLNRRQLSASDGGIERTGMSEGDKRAECSRKCSSSYDSHSIEQIDSASESDQKLSNEAPLAESSCQQQDSDKEEDFYADILKDDIVKLDETPFSEAQELLPFIAGKAETQAQAQMQQPMGIIVSQAIPPNSIASQGIANRRIKLKRQAPPAADAEPSGSGKEEESPKCVVSMAKHRPIFIVFIILTLLALLASWLWGSLHTKRMTYGILYKAFWD